MARAEIKFESNLSGVISKLDQAIIARMEQACIHLTNEVKKTLTGQRSGRIYKVPGTTWRKTVRISSDAKYTLKRGTTGELSLMQGSGKGAAIISTGKQAKSDFAQVRAIAATQGNQVKTIRRTYQASAPGEPPAVRFGQLRNSIKYRVEGEGFKVQGVVGSTVEHAPWMEFGTSKIAPRPFLMPTYRQQKAAIKQILGKTIT